jgi:putative ABC transport system permease protein
MLARSPGFTVLAIAALALGIGATTAIYTVFDTVLIRPLRFPEPERLVMLWEVQPSGRNNVIQTQNFLDWRERSHSFEAVAAMLQLPTNLTGIGDPLQINGLRVSADFFRILKVPPFVGRVISQEEDRPGSDGPGSVVLSYGLFEQFFGARPDTIGQKVFVNGRPAEIVGVMPPGFGLPNIQADLYMPIQLPTSAPRDGRNFRAIARLRSGVSVEAAKAEMKAIARQTELERPEMNTNWSATVVPLLDQVVGNIRNALGVLFVSVTFLLLIACVNVANLLLMRGASRRREISVRLALGASRIDLLRQLTIESLMLALAGGLAGLLLAQLGMHAILSSLPANFPLPRIDEIRIDHRILLLTLTVSILIGVGFGILPGITLRRRHLSESLVEGGRSVVRGQRRIGAVLVGTEVAVAILLVIGAGLMIRSFTRLMGVNAGFRSDHVLTTRMLLLPSKYGPLERRAAVVGQILERVRALPQVSSAGSIHMLPMRGSNSGTWYYRSDRPEPAPGNKPGGDVSVISESYFRSLEVPILAGRDFDDRDALNAPKVAILNQSAAQMLFPGEDPIGKHVKVAWDRQPDAEIVGVVADIRHGGLATKPDPCLFLPVTQEPHLLLSLVIRTQGDPSLLAKAVAEAIHSVDPDQGIAEIKTMDNLINDSVESPRLETILLGLFGAVALLLAAVGIYGTISYSVVQRTREIGVRLALGASPGSVLEFVIRDGMKITLTGAAFGVAAAIGLTTYLQSLLYEVPARDPITYIMVVMTIIAVAAGSCFVPAWRASRVDPATVLRND